MQKLIIFTLIGLIHLTSNALMVIEKSTPFKGSMLYIPNDGKAHPGVVFLHGSEGGSLPFTKMDAKSLAYEGFVVLAFCWYDCSRNPITEPLETLVDIHLERTADAIRWLGNSPHVGKNKVGLFGVSRGAEQALILASKFKELGLSLDQLAAVSVHAASDFVVGGFSWGWVDARCWRGQDSAREWNKACGLSPMDFKDPWNIPAWHINKTPLVLNSRIEVEKYDGPFMLTHGKQDLLWQHDRTERIEAALKKAGKNPEVHYFEGEGHIFMPAAEMKRQELVLQFFKKHLP
jgi:dipeptidyl aminopeptidase/acylaminoacyl peptidase